MNISYLKIAVWVIFVTMSFMGCAGVQPSAQKPAAEADLPVKVETVAEVVSGDTVIFDPMEFVEDGIFTPPKEEDISGQTSAKTTPAATAVTAPSAEEQWEEATRPGFRIQLYATNSVDAARLKEKEAMEVFTEGVYLIYDSPNYKIRIGNCQTRGEAEALQKKAKQLGYKDAWVVRDNITVKVKVE